MTYRTPGVFVEEISKFPASIAEVETAIPAFIGYTEYATNGDGDSLLNKPTRINSMMEYETLFGGPDNQEFEVTLSDDEPHLPQSVDFSDSESPYRLHPALTLFFANGGGPCYIVSVGGYGSAEESEPLDSADAYDKLNSGLEKIRKVDEATLLVIPIADQLQPEDQYNLYQDILRQCNELKDRFGIFDLRREDHDGSEFRDEIGTSFLSYGAAYHPHLKTSLGYSYETSGVSFSQSGTNLDDKTWKSLETAGSALEYLSGFGRTIEKLEELETGPGNETRAEKVKRLYASLRSLGKALSTASEAFTLIEEESFESAELDTARSMYQDVKDEDLDGNNSHDELNSGLADVVAAKEHAVTAMDDIITEVNQESDITDADHEDIRTWYTGEFSTRVKSLLQDLKITLPPSAAIAGIYARVDGGRGVWKSPANVSLSRVSALSSKLSHHENEHLNVHPTGKSINAIRSFTGRGILVWGARTLDGNSNEWRYVSVRRYFNMVEESIKKATEAFVFEPNDANTWVRIKAMVENYLAVQWRAGALMGAKTEEAFFVNIGLGETMTSQDILDGQMIVEVGLAVVRPAEFIILRFTHKMAES